MTAMWSACWFSSSVPRWVKIAWLQGFLLPALLVLVPFAGLWAQSALNGLGIPMLAVIPIAVGFYSCIMLYRQVDVFFNPNSGWGTPRYYRHMGGRAFWYVLIPTVVGGLVCLMAWTMLHSG